MVETLYKPNENAPKYGIEAVHGVLEKLKLIMPLAILGMTSRIFIT